MKLHYHRPGAPQDDIETVSIHDLMINQESVFMAYLEKGGKIQIHFVAHGSLMIEPDPGEDLTDYFRHNFGL